MPPGPVNRKLQTLSSWRHFETKQTADFTKQTRTKEDEKLFLVWKWELLITPYKRQGRHHIADLFEALPTCQNDRVAPTVTARSAATSDMRGVLHLT